MHGEGDVDDDHQSHPSFDYQIHPHRTGVTEGAAGELVTFGALDIVENHILQQRSARGLIIEWTTCVLSLKKM